MKWIGFGATAALVWLAGSAVADEGLTEINQARALAGGITTSDNPGFPITLVPGNYRLTSDLQPGGVLLFLGNTSNDVKIDLNGFTIDGGGTPSNGIQLGSGSNWEIRNGTIRGFGSAIQQSAASSGHRFVRIQALDNSSGGIVVRNGDSHLVEDCIARGNGGAGIALAPSSTVAGTLAFGNAGIGIIVGDDSTVTGCTANKNGEDGIDAGQRTRIVGNVANGNGEGVGDNGIEADQDSLVMGNTVNGNTGKGLSLTGSVGYAQNSINGNTAGTVGAGTELGLNVCDGNTTCP